MIMVWPSLPIKSLKARWTNINLTVSVNDYSVFLTEVLFSTVTWAWTTSLSFQHMYSRTSPVWKNCEYMPSFSLVNEVFTLCNVDMRAGLNDTHLVIWVCIAKLTAPMHNMPFFSAEEDKQSITRGNKSLTAHELNKGSYTSAVKLN